MLSPRSMISTATTSRRLAQRVLPLLITLYQAHQLLGKATPATSEKPAEQEQQHEEEDEPPPSFFGLLFLDFLILVSDVCGFFAFYCVFHSVKRRGPRGVSLQSFLGFAAGRCLHSCSHIFGIHYSPEVFPPFIYLIVDGFAVFMGVVTTVALYCVSNSIKEDFADDVFGRAFLKRILPKQYHDTLFVQFGGLLVFSAIVACFWSVTRCSIITADGDVPFAFSLCMLCSICEIVQIMSVLPQLLMLYKTKKIPVLLGDFLMFQGIAKFCTLTFWLLFPTVNGWSPHNHNMATATEFFNLLILSDFIYFYIKSKAANTLLGRKESEMTIDYDGAHNWV
ncbi:unnamed protein product [Amoebophrya sp. A120]|nr:unnamed protein product [Amoebophrya sp. A120]|eukprot:GSA120T00009924001.1